MRGVATEILRKAEYTNPEGFLEIEADTFQPLGSKVLVQWEEAKEELLGGKLVKPETHRKGHYTGIVLAVGLDQEGNALVDDSIKPGARIFFEQFGGFEKFFDQKYGRLALLREADVLAIVPKRTNIQSMDGDFNYSA